MNRMPAWMGALDRKLVRELWRMKTQALAIAFVIAGGVAVHLLAAGMLSSLQETRRAYYERYLFADVWAPVVRAPQRLIADIRAIVVAGCGRCGGQSAPPGPRSPSHRRAEG
ncbi:MAG: putative ABC transport system permease protein [bacterium]|nr:MAG: putative ABC transport system permease protein [bacterium]